MSLAQLMQWQWDGDSRYRRSRNNLLMHVVAVPLFLVGNVGLVVALFRGSMRGGVLWLACMAASVALQGRGHKMEANPPQPFTGLTNAMARIFLEQWITFPRFVLSGSWLRAPNAPAP